MSSDIEKAVDWFNQNYQVRFTGVSTRRQTVLDSVITGNTVADAVVDTHGSTSIEIPTLDINIPKEQLSKIITQLWYHSRRAEHPAAAALYDQYMTLLHLTERNYYGKTDQ